MAVPQADQQGPSGEDLTGNQPLYSGTRKTHLVWCELLGVIGASKGLAALAPRKEISGKDLN